MSLIFPWGLAYLYDTSDYIFSHQGVKTLSFEYMASPPLEEYKMLAGCNFPKLNLT